MYSVSRIGLPYHVSEVMRHPPFSDIARAVGPYSKLTQDERIAKIKSERDRVINQLTAVADFYIAKIIEQEPIG